MHFLIMSIICSVLVSVLLKLARPKNINLSLAITVNYAVCVLATLLFLQPAFNDDAIKQGLLLFVALGVLLPSIFLVMGKAVQLAGIVKADTAQRLALIIPILSAFVLFGEQLTSAKLIALILVFVAMGCLLYKKGVDKTPAHRHTALALIGVFVGYGVIDVLLKQLSKMGGATSGNLIISFGLALIFMLGFNFYKKYRWDKTSMIGGVILGLLNFANIFTYINAHKAMSDTPTLVFAGMNMGVIVLGALTGLLVFKERLSAINLLGVVIALIAIGQLYLL